LIFKRQSLLIHFMLDMEVILGCRRSYCLKPLVLLNSSS
jgi:hypothetical protein